jgi:hypothetical protein
VPGAGKPGVERQVRRGVAERAAALVARDDGAVELVRAPQHCRCGDDVARRERGADRTRRHARDLGNLKDTEPEPLEECKIASAA